MSRPLRYALVMAASLTAHLPGLTSPLLDYHHQRQTLTAGIARNYHERGLPLLSPRMDWDGDNDSRASTEFPLYTWFVGRLWGLFGLGDLWGRLLSVLFSALTAAALLAFLEGWLAPGPALAGALFFSFIPAEVYFGRTVQPEALALLCMVLSWLALDRLLGPRAARRRAALWAAATAGAALTVGHKMPYAYLLSVSLALAWARGGLRGAAKPVLWLHFAASLGLAASWYLYARSAGAGVLPTSSTMLLKQFEWGRLPYYVFYQTFSRLPELGATYTGLALAAAGAWFARGPEGRFLRAWWLIVLAGVCLEGGYAFTHEYSALPWAPVNAALMGLGAWSLWQRARLLPRRSWARAGVAALVLGVPLHAALRIKHWYRLHYPHLADAEAVADAVSSRDDLFLCNDYSTESCLYHLHRRGWGVDLEKARPSDRTVVEESIRRGARFLFTAKDGVFRDRAHPVARWFYKRFSVAAETPRAVVFRLTRKR